MKQLTNGALRPLTRARIQRWKSRFLAELSRHPDVKRAAKFAGIARRTAYDARARDETFAAAWNAAIAASIDEVEAKVMEAGLKGDMNVAMFLLRCHKPSIYRETNRVELDARLVGVLVVPEKEQKDPLHWQLNNNLKFTGTNSG